MCLYNNIQWRVQHFQYKRRCSSRENKFFSKTWMWTIYTFARAFLMFLASVILQFLCTWSDWPILCSWTFRFQLQSGDVFFFGIFFAHQLRLTRRMAAVFDRRPRKIVLFLLVSSVFGLVVSYLSVLISPILLITHCNETENYINNNINLIT